jgi:hypothetical protein
MLAEIIDLAAVTGIEVGLPVRLLIFYRNSDREGVRSHW